MRRAGPNWIVALATLAVVLFSTSCGGGDDGGGPTDPPPPPPPPPAPVASVTVTPVESTILVGETAQLSAATLDAAGATLTGRAVAWSTSDTQVASVVGGLVTAVAAGSANITATSEGRSGSATVTVSTPTLEPTSDINLSGTQSYDEVMIPAGVTVTATDNLTMDVAGAVNIEGTIAGECVDITINGQAAVTIKGTISNACTLGQTEMAAVTITGDGDLTIEDGTIEAGGDVTIKNDPTLTEADFPEEGQALSGLASSAAAGTQAGTCSVSNFIFLPNPVQARSGADGQFGENGEDGHTWVLLCRGNAILAGGVRVFGQDGGDGGRGTHESTTDATATGGWGGDGGKLRLLATGTWQFTGSGNELIGGDGGVGGAAQAEGKRNPDIDPAARASAVGGEGGASGLVEVRSLVSIAEITESGVLSIVVGDGRPGGDATALGAHGVDSSERPDKPAQVGGSVIALGGHGGFSPPFQFRATGSASTSNVDISGGNGAEGGDANMDPGDGGDGDEEFKDGAKAGSSFKPLPAPSASAAPTNAWAASPVRVVRGPRRVSAGTEGVNAGDGGNAQVRDANGALVGIGGKGGALAVQGGHGGFGFDGCSVMPVTLGGDGGRGGLIEGADAPGGTGKTNGDPGGVEVIDLTGWGGDGGDGEWLPGFGGEKGTDALEARGPRIDSGNNFKDGKDGTDCHSGIFDLEISVLSDPYSHAGIINLLISILNMDLSDFVSTGASSFSASGLFPFVDVTGTRDEDGNVWADGIGIVAGFPNIYVTLAGLLLCDGTFSFEYIMGAAFGLPGAPISYGLTGSMQSGSSAPPRLKRVRPWSDDGPDPAPARTSSGGCGR